ncbi:MAG: tetratricopeptide repeat protein [Elusimicrobiaceae bacterium]|nr:tetratricopeptide repeat protein [Elusimicrobiaceae bacterium]
MKFILGIILGVILALGVFLSLPQKEKALYKKENIAKNKQTETAPVLKGPLNILEALDKYIELNPTDSNAYLQKADYLAKNGKLKEALPFYDKALYYDGRNAQAYMNRGAVNYMLGNYEAAKRDLSVAINLDSSKGENFFNRALANINLGSYNQAKDDFKKAATLFNKAADRKSFDKANQGYQAASAMLAQKTKRNTNTPSVNNQGNFEENTFKTTPNEALNKQYTSQLMTSLSNTNGMLEKFKEARQKAGSEPGVMPDFESYASSMREQAGQKFKQETSLQKTFLDYKDEAYKKQALGDTKGALEAINKAIELNPKEADLYRQRAQLNMAAKDPKAAISDYTKALNLNPKDASSLYNRALVRDMIGDKKGAKQDMAKALDEYQKQGNKEGVKQAQEMKNLWEGKQVSSPRQDKDFIEGANAFNSGKYQEALRNWDNLIKKYPQEASAYYNRAITNARLNNTVAAEKDYRQAIKLNPNMTEALDGLSSVLVGQGKAEQAMPYIEQSLKINPENPGAYRMRAVANMEKNPNQALKDFGEALSYDREDAVSYFYRGILNAQNNNVQAGISDLQSAITYGQKQNNKQIVETAQNILNELKQQGN